MSTSTAQMDHLTQLRCIQEEVRRALKDADGAAARKKVAEFSQTLAESSQSLAPYDVQAMLAIQRELTSEVQRAQKNQAAQGIQAAFTFKKKSAVGGRPVPPPGKTPGALEPSSEMEPSSLGADLLSKMPATDSGEVRATSIDASAHDPAASSLVVENRSDAEVRIRKLDVLQQVRIRGCENVTFKLYYNDGQSAMDNDKIVVEASKGLSFGFFDEASELPLPRRTVRDFGWLRPGPSPNISWL